MKGIVSILKKIGIKSWLIDTYLIYNYPDWLLRDELGVILKIVADYHENWYLSINWGVYCWVNSTPEEMEQLNPTKTILSSMFWGLA